MSDSRQKPADALREEVAQLRDALRNVRESVVLRVMHRNRVAEEVQRLEKGVQDMERGIALAESIQNTEQADLFRKEKETRTAELERMRESLTAAEADVEMARLRLPEDEASILRQLNDLQARSIRVAADTIESSGTPGIGNNAADLWERATSKISQLRHEASAREEMLGGTKATSGEPAQTPPRLSPDESAEQMLLAMEARMAAQASAKPSPVAPSVDILASAPSPPAPGTTAPHSSERASYLEFDDPAPESPETKQEPKQGK